MTREEASIIIGNIPINGDECYSIPEYQQAKAMAIKALEQQPCEDAISRKDMLAIFRQSNSLSQAWDGFEKLSPVTPKEKTCEDCISRQALKRKLQENHDFFINAYGGFSNMSQNDKSRVDEIINCIAMVVNEPSVTPKEKSESEHDHEVVKAYNDGQAYILDKIRAEIERLQKEQSNHYGNEIETAKYDSYDDCLDVIDKYREVSE